ncbi:MAG: NnrS family protein [Gammaproteobacteria bacterium]|nr:NnrS family protein [Gammaproteobacteria bacterium]NNL06734.1 NnrS family protein [Gammaproteobacteria bacterium]
MINLEKEIPTGMPLFRLGFRPFFLGAALFAVVLVFVWMIVYIHGARLDFSGLTPTTWHAHEMIFGYAMAVIAGFLLTAIKNWTGRQTLRGPGLVVLFLLWLLARLVPLTGMNVPLAVWAMIDLLFMLLLVIAATMPVLQVKQYSQLGIISKLVLLMLSNAMFYLGAAGVIEQGERWGLYSGIYMVIALVLVMARRVIPFFIEKGVEGRVEIKNRRWVDVSSLVLLIGLWITDVFTNQEMIVSVMAAILTVLHMVRMAGWYTVRIWHKPLLWVLYLAYGFIVAGFALTAAETWYSLSPGLAVHAYTYGGVGVMTLGMMSRVILGHTGRNVFEPPRVLTWCFVLLLSGALVRVLFPLFSMGMYTYWIVLSQFFWIAAFALFIVVTAPMLLMARVDGRDG